MVHYTGTPTAGLVCETMIQSGGHAALSFCPDESLGVIGVGYLEMTGYAGHIVGLD
jgi:hypothetical protein